MEASNLTLKDKEQRFKLESEKMIEQTQELIKNRNIGQYYTVRTPD